MASAIKESSRIAPCPRISHPFYAYSRSTNRAYAIPCGSWSCPACSRRKKGAARRAIEIGMARAFAAGRRVRFITLTDDSSGEMTVRQLYTNWNRLRIKLKRKGYLDQFAACVEMQERGALHLHLLATGSYCPQKVLKEMAVSAGFGSIVDIREVKRDASEDDKRAASYVAKELAGYVSKDGASIADKVNVRRRPVRFSRDWGCSLGAAAKMIAEEIAEERGQQLDPGPWVVVRVAPDGTLLPQSGKGLPRAIPPLSDPQPTEELAGRQAVASDEGGVGAIAA